MKTSLRREAVQHILKHGKRYARKGLVVCVLHSDDCSGKFAILIAKKVLAGAVARNNLRRVLREVIRRSGYRDGGFVVLHTNKKSSKEEVADQLRLLLTDIAGT